MSPLLGRRSFVSMLASLPGLAALGAPDEAAASVLPLGAADEFDMAWLDEMKGKHKQLYDLGSADLSADAAVLRFGRNFLDTARDTFKLQFPDVNTAVGISGPAFAMNASDRLWEKYRLGERSKIMDPATKQPAVRNVFLEGSDISVKAMQARGTIFWQCNVALGGVARQLAAERKERFEDVRADLVAGLVPGVKLMPSHVLALALAQERGFTYMKP